LIFGASHKDPPPGPNKEAPPAPPAPAPAPVAVAEEKKAEAPAPKKKELTEHEKKLATSIEEMDEKEEEPADDKEARYQEYVHE